jgi:hypothetical protein
MVAYGWCLTVASYRSAVKHQLHDSGCNQRNFPVEAFATTSFKPPCINSCTTLVFTGYIYYRKQLYVKNPTRTLQLSERAPVLPTCYVRRYKTVRRTNIKDNTTKRTKEPGNKTQDHPVNTCSTFYAKNHPSQQFKIRLTLTATC